MESGKYSRGIRDILDLVVGKGGVELSGILTEKRVRGVITLQNRSW